jgi:effector-binding domain-containing protein
MPNLRIERRKATKLAYLKHQGPYDKVPWDDYIKRLYGWAKEQKVMPGFYPLAIYYDDPQKKPQEKLRSEIGITFKGTGKGKAGVKIGQLAAMTVATISHKGPATEFKNTYAKLFAWIKAKGYKMSGNPIEIYTKKPSVIGGVTVLYAKVMMPVKKK